MKKVLLLLTFLILYIIAFPVYGADKGISISYDPKTGDTAFDTMLGNLNLHTQGDSLSDFISNLSISYKISRTEIENLLFEEDMSPADTYMTVGLADISDKPVQAVVEEYNKKKKKGWGAIAKGLGIKPGSKKFKALKDGGYAQLDKIKDKGGTKNKSNAGKKSRKK